MDQTSHGNPNRPIYCSVRTDSGNAISKEKPSFAAGAAGGSGRAVRDFSDPDVGALAVLPSRPGDFVSMAIGNIDTVGGSQARRARRMVVDNLTDRIIRLQNHPCPKAFYGFGSNMTRWC